MKEKRMKKNKWDDDKIKNISEKKGKKREKRRREKKKRLATVGGKCEKVEEVNSEI